MDVVPDADVEAVEAVDGVFLTQGAVGEDVSMTESFEEQQTEGVDAIEKSKAEQADIDEKYVDTEDEEDGTSEDIAKVPLHEKWGININNTVIMIIFSSIYFALGWAAGFLYVTPLFVFSYTTWFRVKMYKGAFLAALATILSRGVATAIGLWILFGTGYGPDVTLGHLAPDLDFIRDIFRLGLPSSVEQTTSALAMITLTAMIVTFSPPVVAAYGLGNRLISLVFLPAMGLGRAIDTMVGQNLGANRADRAGKAVKFAATTGAGVMFLVAVVAVTFTEPIVGAFLGDVPDAPATIGYAVEYVRIRSVEFAFIGVSQVILGAFRGAGNTKTAMVISIVTLWVGRVASVAYLVFVAGWGETGVWVGMALGNVLGAILGVAWFSRGTWTDRYIDEPEPGVDPVGDD